MMSSCAQSGEARILISPVSRVTPAWLGFGKVRRRLRLRLRLGLRLKLRLRLRLGEGSGL